VSLVIVSYLTYKLLTVNYMNLLIDVMLHSYK